MEGWRRNRRDNRESVSSCRHSLVLEQSNQLPMKIGARVVGVLQAIEIGANSKKGDATRIKYLRFWQEGEAQCGISCLV